MRLSIIPEDRAVVKDMQGVNFADNLNDYIATPIPADIHALQWNEDAGEIEYVELGRANEQISELPAWANECVSLYETTLAALAKTDSPEASE